MEERLQKLLARAGVASRRKAETLIRQGRVAVNGQVITETGFRADPERDGITVDGRPVALEPPVYYVVNKPRGVVTTMSDPQGRPTVADLARQLGIGARVFPVGRLDAETEGLLILTNDGSLAFRLTHPRYEVDKTYHALVEGVPGPVALRTLARGVPLEDGVTAPARARLVARDGERTWIEVTIHEGRKRQVRRMCLAVGHPVVRLRRVRVGPLDLGDLDPGAGRPLTGEEVARLKAAVSSGRAGRGGAGNRAPGAGAARRARDRRGPPGHAG